jgi:hypothetical protein
MPRHTHDTQSDALMQSPLPVEQETGWEAVLARLPQDLESRAREEKAFVRARHLRCAADLLRGLLAYVWGVYSFRQLGIWASTTGLSQMGERAWAKRMQRACSWLLWLLSSVLLTEPPEKPVQGSGHRILLVDASHLKEPGKTGKSWRVHLSYDVLEARMQELVFTPQQAESLLCFHPIPGAIRVADRGYCKREPIARHLLAGEDVVVRLAWSNVPLEHADGSPFDIGAYLGSSTSDQMRFEEPVWIQTKQGRFALRLIGKRVSPEAAARERRARKSRAQQQGQQLQETTLLLCDWIVVVTSLSETTWSATHVLHLYRARWQIELLFKRIKQLLQRHALLSHHALSNQAVFATLLLGWALVEEQAGVLKVALQDDLAFDDWEQEQARHPVSSWQVAAALVHSLRSMILGQWTWEHITQRAGSLRRLFTAHPQDRIHSETTLRRDLVAHLAAG